MKTTKKFKIRRKLISKIRIDKSNLDFIAKTGTINGTLLIEIEKAMEQYAQRPSLRNEFIKFLMEIDECYACHIPENAKAVVDDYLKHSTEQRGGE